jgi:hypothetical protein
MDGQGAADRYDVENVDYRPDLLAHRMSLPAVMGL